MTSRARRIERQLLLSALLTVSVFALGCGHDSPTAPSQPTGSQAPFVPPTSPAPGPISPIAGPIITSISPNTGVVGGATLVEIRVLALGGRRA